VELERKSDFCFKTRHSNTFDSTGSIEIGLRSFFDLMSLTLGMGLMRAIFHCLSCAAVSNASLRVKVCENDGNI